MDDQNMKIKAFLSTRAMLLATGISTAVMALPEDAEQPIHAVYDNSELLLDEGIQVLYGSTGSPAEITQGTLKITGREITIERQNGEVRKVTVEGTPARYQQKPSADQDMVTAEGLNIVLDYDTQHVLAQGQVRFIQAGNEWRGCQIDYYIETRRVTTPRCEDGEQAQAILPPRNNQ